MLPGQQNSGEEHGEETDAQTFSVEYGITSLVDKKTVLQAGDKVRVGASLEDAVDVK